MTSYSIKRKGRPKKEDKGQYKIRNIDRLRGLKGWNFSHSEGKKMYFRKTK